MLLRTSTTRVSLNFSLGGRGCGSFMHHIPPITIDIKFRVFLGGGGGGGGDVTEVLHGF